MWTSEGKAGSVERESGEESNGEMVSTKRQRMTSAVVESSKDGMPLPSMVVLAVRRFWFRETSVTLFPENDESTTAKREEEWRLAVVPVPRGLFLGPAMIIFYGESGDGERKCEGIEGKGRYLRKMELRLTDND